MKNTECLLCSGVTESGHKFYDHLEDVHMMPIRRIRIGDDGIPREETHDECIERFEFTHIEYGTKQCWCPDCLGGETLKLVNEVSSQFDIKYIKEKHK